MLYLDGTVLICHKGLMIILKLRLGYSCSYITANGDTVVHDGTI